MPSRSGRASHANRAARRRTAWATVTATHSVPAANGYDSIDLLAQYKAAVGESTAGITIGRIHLKTVWTTGMQATGNNFAEGIIVSDANDVGTNIVGAPRPAADLHLDWMFWEWTFVSGAEIATTGSAIQGRDLKSMRKMHQVGNTLMHVVQAPASSTFPAVMQVTGRILLLLP
jgi:hypothetical protein